jgi:hypothetical protein
MLADFGSMVHATWSRRIGPMMILAFRDHSYGIYFGTRNKPTLFEVQWHWFWPIGFSSQRLLSRRRRRLS